MVHPGLSSLVTWFVHKQLAIKAVPMFQIIWKNNKQLGQLFLINVRLCFVKDVYFYLLIVFLTRAGGYFLCWSTMPSLQAKCPILSHGGLRQCLHDLSWHVTASNQIAFSYNMIWLKCFNCNLNNLLLIIALNNNIILLNIVDFIFQQTLLWEKNDNSF